MISPQFEPHFEGFRLVARDLLQKKIHPGAVHWETQDQSQCLMFDDLDVQEISNQQDVPFSVPKEFFEMAKLVACAREPGKWSLLYRVLYRLKFVEPQLLKISVDTDVLQMQRLAKSVSRDIHKMHAFVRFKSVTTANSEYFIAWHQPEHLIVQLATPFFARRFGDKPWSIFTPDESAHWDLNELVFKEGMPFHEFSHRDQFDDMWKTYYSSIFNPARIKLKAMRNELPTKYWASLPEAELISSLVQTAPQRLQEMAMKQKKIATVEKPASLEALHAQAHKCQACPLFLSATQTVVGVGPQNASLMIVGEQPGDHEDLQGQPFVGPSGELLDQVLSKLGVSRSEIYITNAVKHFKWKPQGKVRLHQKPSGDEMHACKPWLEAEIELVQPKVILLLGATAGTAILGQLPKVSQDRGKLISLNSHTQALLSWHPSALLRNTSQEEKEERLQQLTADIALAVQLSHAATKIQY